MDVAEQADRIADSSSQPRQHWLAVTAQRANLEGAAALEIPTSLSVEDAWGRLMECCPLPETDVVAAIANALHIGAADQVTPEAAALDLVPGELAARHRVVPLAIEQSTLIVAAADPFDYNAEKALSFASGHSVAFALATPAWIRAALHDPRAGRQEGEGEEDFKALLEDIDSSASDQLHLEPVEEDPDEEHLAEINSEPVVRATQMILREAIRQRASDVHLEPDQGRGIVRFRVDGVIRPYMHVPLTFHDRVISRLKVLARLDISNRLRPQDGQLKLGLEGGTYSIRLSTVPTENREKLVMRIIGNDKLLRLEDLRLTDPELERLHELLGCRDGVIIVTGPTGSGKTTTLYSILETLRDRDVNIVTVEDPVERELAGITQIEVRTRQGVTFVSALRAVLRQDPDVVLIGEIRDAETAQIALQAAMTGHLVLATLHTVNAVSAVSRLQDLGVDPSLLGMTLRGVLAQRLARSVCTRCGGDAEAEEPCRHCGGTGYHGRLPITEVLVVSRKMREQMQQRASEQTLEAEAIASGMRPMHTAALDRVVSGETTTDELERVLGRSAADAPVKDGPHPDPQLQAAGPVGELGTGETGTAVVVPDAENASGPTGLAVERAEDVGGLPAVRADRIRMLLQGLDRALTEGESSESVLQFACEQLAAAFDFPLVWAGLREHGSLRIRTRAGALGPFLTDVVDVWDLHEDGTGPISRVLRSGDPEAVRIAQEEGFTSWREFSRIHRLPVMLIVPLRAGENVIGVIALHAHAAAPLDAVSGADILVVAERLAAVFARARLQRDMQIHLQALHASVDAVFTLGRDGRIESVNPRFEELTGYTTEEAVGQTMELLHSDRHEPGFYQQMWTGAIANRTWRGEVYYQLKDGSVQLCEQTITRAQDPSGTTDNFVVVLRAITLSAADDRPEPQGLQHLPDRKQFETRLQAAVQQAERGSLSLLFAVRVDGHASIMESDKPDDAEELLVTAAVTMRGGLRSEDVVAYLGGSEFAVLVLNLPPHLALAAADRLRSSVESYTYTAEIAWAMPTLSIGMLLIDGSHLAHDAIELARSSFSDDPRFGLIHYHTTESLTYSRETVEWSRRIQDALANDHLELFFQPVIEIASRRIQHFDALLRLRNPDGEVVSAGAFLQHVESVGLIPRVDQWAVGHALDLLDADPELRLSLNISGMSLADPRFRAFVRQRQRDMADLGGRLLLEVPELIRDVAHAGDRMTWLQDAGCRFILDNFGITASALACLGALPIDYVKLDGKLIQGLASGDVEPSLIQAIATVARAMGKGVIAGWAESEAVLDLLPPLGVEYAQGYHVGTPTADLITAGVDWAR